MLTERMVQATIPAADIDRAVRWYEEKLGFKPVSRIEGGAMYRAAGGTGFFLYATPHAGQAPQTVMSFLTPDVEKEVRDLKARGVAFEEYDLPGIKTVDSIAAMGPTRGAWFKDSEGNIIGLVQEPT
jgi:catechol 2,3-dioxygenase-like lactoylglutathione lyase family enzyme